ncbi:hypothetical protein CMV_025802 [Castanea mollissima]|uniref:Protein kinase domain-containing protein n=1 Tax=Castanea mollissima TaxID=60419 RepID=A0A8J4QKZ5_9ROSI|nr:hypothetical protein CMV_025802 [Castanea mollissima]
MHPSELGERKKEDVDVPLFNFTTVATATNKFSPANVIGAGGFGPIYKGRLCNGQDIAVKRLSKNSRQGLEEFKNEVVLIAKLQHRNLVKLLGYCVEGDEKMLIYEYMPNKSLDCCIFEQNDNLLAWPKRFDIIIGIVRGLLYLHQDSRLQVIHRDLKASNILLDINLNPKISDFGLARTFVRDESEVKTDRVVGTYGYMSPEYAVDGRFSVKSDVFSIGSIHKLNKKKRVVVIITASIISRLLPLGLLLRFTWKTTNRRRERKKEDVNVPLFNFTTVATATNKFSPANVIAQVDLVLFIR